MTIPFVTLNNGVKMPQEGFGVFQVTDLEQCKQAVKDALNLGYRLLDTASSYQNEEAVGAAIKESGVPRQELFLTTKAYMQEMGYEKTKEAFDRSCKKLGTDYLDLYLIHMPLADYYGSWRAMTELYQAGRIRAIGVCNFLPDRLVDLCFNTDIVPAVNQLELHPFYQRADELALLKEYGVQPEAWAPFAEGMNGMFTNPVLSAIAEAHGKTTAQVILRWNVQRGVVIIPKSVHKERMEQNLAIWDFALTDAEMQQIASLDLGRPQMLDTRNVKEVRRVYDYLNNPVVTSL
ncbi:aldo/keto reductase [Acidaminococcus sp. NSJ-142]|jgi:diketogulonate reductase-like aldo/keto reductase|nr:MULTISPECIES: aldo/keto reductase [Acidaminococcus]MCD2435176.1 aldo/keto reductase [Acidaminococcus hominis]MCH4097224.1 aldo/keto reductase [Acidaminococcus provencensis]